MISNFNHTLPVPTDTGGAGALLNERLNKAYVHRIQLFGNDSELQKHQIYLLLYLLYTGLRLKITVLNFHVPQSSESQTQRFEYFHQLAHLVALHYEVLGQQ